MAKVLNTSGTTFFLEELIKGTRQRLTLISPFLRINTRIRQLIEDANLTGIEVDVIYGKNELHPEEEHWLSSLENLAVYFCENLHAKCYLNESSAIVTSMNLYEFSQVSNNEKGLLLDRKSDHEAFEETEKEAQRLLRISEEHKSRTLKQAPSSMLESHEPAHRTALPEEIYQKLTTSRLAEVCKVKTQDLLEYFTAKGYLEIREGKHFLAERGKERGAEVRFGKNGIYFLWPKDMLKKFQDRDKTAPV
jgi:hypothetical protein